MKFNANYYHFKLHPDGVHNVMHIECVPVCGLLNIMFMQTFDELVPHQPQQQCHQKKVQPLALVQHLKQNLHQHLGHGFQYDRLGNLKMTNLR